MSKHPVIQAFPLGDYQTNCYIVTPTTPAPGMECWIVDCGMEPAALIRAVQQQQLKPVALLLTHTHVDHIAGIDEMLRSLGPMPMYVHEAEAGFCSDPMLNLSPGIGLEVRVTEPDHHLRGGETLHLGNTAWRVVHTPGHSPGSVCFVHDESGQAITGDTLFAGSIGRFDLPGADGATLRRTLIDTMMSWPDEMKVFPGHGPATTIGRERRTNPFILHGF